MKFDYEGYLINRSGLETTITYKVPTPYPDATYLSQEMDDTEYIPYADGFAGNIDSWTQGTVVEVAEDE